MLKKKKVEKNSYFLLLKELKIICLRNKNKDIQHFFF